MLEGAAPFEGERRSQEAFPPVAVHDRLDPVALASETICDVGVAVPAVQRNCIWVLETAIVVAVDDGINSIDWIAKFTFGELDIIKLNRLMYPRQPVWPASARVYVCIGPAFAVKPILRIAPSPGS